MIAKGGTPKAAVNKGASDTIALLTVLGTSVPRRVTVNEFTTVASVWTCAQFLKGEVLSGKQLGLRIAAGNVANFVDIETGGYGGAIQDALNRRRRRRWQTSRHWPTCWPVASRR